jgi:TRAP-type transport system small permease protein
MALLIDHVRHWTLKAIGWLLAMLLAAMVAVTFVQVIKRYGFDSGLAWAEEFCRYCFVWIVFLGSVPAFDRGLHIGVDLITARLATRYRRIAAIGAELLVVTFCAVIVYASIPVLQVNALQVSPALEIQMSVVYAVIPISMGLICVLGVLRIVRILMGSQEALEGQHGVEI